MTYGTDILLQLVMNHQEPEADKLHNTLGDLIDQNAALGGPQWGFMYKGKFWTLYPKEQHHQLTKEQIHPDLVDEAKAMANKTAELSKERERLIQGLTLVLRDCYTGQDVRDMLPDTLLSILPPEVSELTRTRKPGWSLKAKPLHSHQYQKILDLIDLRVGNRLIS